MGTLLEGMATVHGGWRRGHSARRLAVDAARRSLHLARRRPDEVEVLVNAGLFRDRNLGEPALAPMIQEDLGANPEDPHPGGHGTFSFDVANGSCGVLTALEVAHGFLHIGTAQTVLVVTSDADPGHGLAPGFPFRAAGGALVCCWSEGAPGLGPVHWHHAEVAEDEDVVATVGDTRSGNVLVVREGAAFATRAGDSAAAAALDALDEAGVKPTDVDLVVASPDRPAFRTALAEGTGIEDDRIVSAGSKLHTVAFVAALEQAAAQGALSGSPTVLFACAGAGITAGAAVYRP